MRVRVRARAQRNIFLRPKQRHRNSQHILHPQHLHGPLQARAHSNAFAKARTAVKTHPHHLHRHHCKPAHVAFVYGPHNGAEARGTTPDILRGHPNTSVATGSIFFTAPTTSLRPVTRRTDGWMGLGTAGLLQNAINYGERTIHLPTPRPNPVGLRSTSKT